jgi:hypothetical protein
MKAICTVIIVVSLILLAGCRDEVADRNYENLKLVREGMHWREVRAIMGDWQYCDTISGIKYPGEDGIPNYQFSYKAPALFSGDFIIFVTVRDSLVTSVYRGD